MDIFANSQIAVAFCSPHRKIRLPNGREILDTITLDWHRKRQALAVGTNCNFIELFADGMEIGVARTQAAERCLKHTPRPKYLFFLDDDVLPDFDAFTKLFFRLQTHPEFDVAAGIYACKGLCEPLIYAGDGCGPYWDWAIGDLLTTDEHGVTATHMGLTLIKVDLFQRILDAGLITEETPFFKTVKEHGRNAGGGMQTLSGTEDLYFYQHAKKVGAKIMVDTSVLAGHIDKTTGITWGLPDECPPVVRAKWLNNKDADKELKLALDLGAGGTRRQWQGYRTYTTDIRADAKPDYVQDSLHLNLPNDHFDLVASSHHLEHIGRWDQERVWSECFRICKPGGRIEHIVPSIEWAAWKINDGALDEHVFNVLYGAQEAHGYQRQFNLHYFGYTKAIAKELAEAAGFVNVVCRDWRDDDKLGYNLVITGEKPMPVPTVKTE